LKVGLGIMLACVASLGCGSPDAPSDAGRALGGWPDVWEAPKVALDDVGAGSRDGSQGDADAQPGDVGAEVRDDARVLRVEASPEVLQVYRSTVVRLRASRASGVPGPCRWSFGDGTPEAVGCEVEHTFIGGTADERVTVVMGEDDARESATRILPLERLPVSTRPIEPSEAGAAGDVPKKPSGSGSFRMVLIADTATMDRPQLEALLRRVVAIEADLVVHLGGHAQDAEGWVRLRDVFGEGLRAAGITLLDAVSPADLELGAEVRRPIGARGEPVELLDGARFPERWALSHEGVFMAFVSGAEQDKDDLEFLKARLAEAQVYESRLVLSYLPIHPFGERAPPGNGSHTLGPRFKVYETLLRARTTALITAGHGVYFKGRYGALPVVSVGSPAGDDGVRRLLGSDLNQAPSITVIDLAQGLPKAVFALVASPSGEPFSTPLDERYLPETVEVYTQ
jgi:hypothetical protein